ncbi:sigma-70 family RNA polymerase sigma factor [Clostridiaceae bacterium NSJ-31]|uniref:Sigma-70 family RNA polymerase sigma factor n=2 Tax=Ligaoa zhengdingensis TaxID=2763658 RepID=A0A926I5C6_9FIRM|nr:sigma factor-like helix-turn-helix DNA-binding protein [Ligaoa zhengdingensis]MBC8547325.1 sigma-70 family RNA polymerase sigma factor [Ligaoa zhengdingensis]
MTEMEKYRVHIEYTFNAFCKIFLYHASINICRKLRKKQQYEVSLDYLEEIHFEPEYTEEAHTAFLFRGTEISIENEQLACALLKLPEKRREILFLRFFLGYSDMEIGKMYGRCRTTIFRRRKAALRLLRKEMEAPKNEE